MNAKMPELKRAFEAAGFANVKTVLGSGNVVFDAGKSLPARLQAKAEAAMEKHLGKSFLTIVWPVSELESLLASNPYKGHGEPAGAKRIVTFLFDPPAKGPKLPIELDGARILAMKEGAVFGDYVASDKGPVFMTLLLKTFGKAQTTRTWQTLEKVARA